MSIENRTLLGRHIMAFAIHALFYLSIAQLVGLSFRGGLIARETARLITNFAFPAGLTAFTGFFVCMAIIGICTEIADIKEKGCAPGVVRA